MAITRTGRHLPATLLAAALVSGLAACAGAPAAAPSSPPPSGERSPAGNEGPPVRLAVVGDSITDGDSPDLAGGQAGPTSWVSAATGDGVEVTGAWAVWGALTEQMAAGVGPMDADVLVIMAGTNDVALGIPERESLANLEEIARRAQVETVLVSAIPPIDPAPEAAASYNSALATHADQQGWTFVDVPPPLHDGGVFAPGMSADGVHPTTEGAAVLGRALGEAVRDAARAGT